MKRIGELTANMGVGEPVAPARPMPPKSGPAGYIFLRMQGAYGSMWLDKWRTGILDPTGRDLGVASAMAQWDTQLSGFAKDVIVRACELVGERPDAKFPPSLFEFLAFCRAQIPPRSSPVALPNKLKDDERRAALARLAEMRQQAADEREPSKAKAVGAIDRLQDLITEAYRNAGGKLEDLVAWSPTRKP